MIRTTFTAAAIALAALAAPSQADTVKDALCVLQRLPPTNLPYGAVAALLPPEEFRCDFTQMQGNVYVDSVRWAFKFPAAEQGKTYARQNTEDFKRFTREGQYTLTVFESGEKPNEPGGF